jgi:hypothetical protein
MAIRRFKSMNEIRLLPGFVEKIQKGAQEFACFLGYYRLPRREVHCAKSDCNTPHGFGYVVMTKSGAITVIGHVCGEKVFGDIFTAAAHSADAEMRRQMAESAIADALTLLPGYRQRADALMHGRRGALWLERAERSLQSHIPRRLAGEIYALASHGSGAIVRTRLRTRKDVPPLGTHGVPDVVEETFGKIVGVGALAAPSPKRILTDQVLAEMPIFDATTPGYLVDNKLKHRRFNEWVIGIPHAIREAEDRLRRAIVFFETGNLRILANVARTPHDRRQLSMLKWNDASGLVELESASASNNDSQIA